MQIIPPNEGGTPHRPIKMWTEGVEVEDEARQQLINTASMPFIHPHLAVMPDVHWGNGSTVGSVIPTRSAIIPAAVGVDIGCGMMAVRLHDIRAVDLPDNLSAIRSAIEAVVPVGFNEHKERQTMDYEMMRRLMVIRDKAPALDHIGKAQQQLGTLGGGNHFVELCLDEAQNVWVMLHSGSRGIGNRIGTYYIDAAKEDMRRYYCNIPDVNLAFIPENTKLFADYVEALNWAQEYAMENRRRMMQATLAALYRSLGFSRDVPINLANYEMAVNCHHNYVSKEHHFGQNLWITRKGAVRAREGDLGIIPGSMGAKSFIIRGKGNEDSFHSCSHGAGRRMSRGKAKKLITLEDHLRDTAGVECRKDADVIDESPAAYKSIDAVMAAQDDLVSIVHTLKQVLCVKG
jgi:tRNA-splicing ligase RtcB (3'-phosphate/5'-hydroxy nucleic acid ligase)